MKRFALLTTAVFLFSAVLFLASSQPASAAAFMSPSFGGTTGYIATPSAKTGWAGKTLALDIGYHYIGDAEGCHIPKVNFQLFGRVELGMAFDIQDQHDDDNDMIIHGKFNFYNAGASALAVGGNVQLIDMGNDTSNGTAGQFYVAVTYSGNFFGMPALTTLVLGKSFGTRTRNADVDFSMGFDLDFLPKYLKGYVHWVSDFANYSYSVEGLGSEARYRASFNTGFRFAILKTSRYKFNIDIVMTDALDDNRSWSIGTAFGLAIL